MSLTDDLRQAVRDYMAETDPPRSVNWTAKRFGVPTPTLHRWLKDERTITIETANKIAASLGLRLTRPNQRPKKGASKTQ